MLKIASRCSLFNNYVKKSNDYVKVLQTNLIHTEEEIEDVPSHARIVICGSGLAGSR